MSNNIRSLRKAREWSIRELAERLSAAGNEVHFTTVAKIERSERKLTQDWMQRFATALDVQPSEIIGAAGAADQVVLRQLPVIGMVAAGSWLEAIQLTDRFVVVPAKGPNAFGLVVDGDSMNKVAFAGTIVIVDPDQSDLHDGSYYVVMNGEGETTFKQYRAGPARLEPCSTNAAHQTIVLGRSPFSTVGKVVGAYQDLS